MKKIKEIMQFFECFLLNAMKNEGNNAIFECFLFNVMKNEESKGNNAFF
jgi:hypothetical protein